MPKENTMNENKDDYFELDFNTDFKILKSIDINSQEFSLKNVKDIINIEEHYLAIRKQFELNYMILQSLMVDLRRELEISKNSWLTPEILTLIKEISDIIFSHAKFNYKAFKKTKFKHEPQFKTLNLLLSLINSHETLKHISFFTEFWPEKSLMLFVGIKKLHQESKKDEKFANNVCIDFLQNIIANVRRLNQKTPSLITPSEQENYGTNFETETILKPPQTLCCPINLFSDIVINNPTNFYGQTAENYPHENENKNKVNINNMMNGMIRDSLDVITTNNVNGKNQILSSYNTRNKTENNHFNSNDIRNTPANHKENSNLSNNSISIALVEPSEFEEIPSYMKGRIKLSEVNNLIEKMNLTFLAKRDFARHNSKNANYRKLSKDDQEYYNKYKLDLKQMGSAVSPYITEEDIKRFADIKVDKGMLKLFVILRHLKRTREVRTTGEMKTIKYFIA